MQLDAILLIDKKKKCSIGLEIAETNAHFVILEFSHTLSTHL